MNRKMNNQPALLNENGTRHAVSITKYEPGQDAFLALKGCINTTGGEPLKDHDMILYGAAKDSAVADRLKQRKATRRKCYSPLYPLRRSEARTKGITE